MSWLQTLNQLSEKAPTKAHIDLLKEQISAIERERDKLQVEVNRLSSENQKLRASVASAQKVSAFEEFEGLFWKRNAQGQFEPAPYCPHCDRHPRMTNFEDIMWRCSVCKFHVDFDGVNPPSA